MKDCALFCLDCKIFHRTSSGIEKAEVVGLETGEDGQWSLAELEVMVDIRAWLGMRVQVRPGLHLSPKLVVVDTEGWLEP